MISIYIELGLNVLALYSIYSSIYSSYVRVFLSFMMNMFLHGCWVDCTIMNGPIGLVLFLLVFFILIEHNTKQHMCLGLNGCKMCHWAVCQTLPWCCGLVWRLSLLIVLFDVLPSPSAGINLSQQGLTDSRPDTRCLLSLLFPHPLLTLPGHSHWSELSWVLAPRLLWCYCTTACTKGLSELVLMWIVMHLFHIRCLLYL